MALKNVYFDTWEEYEEFVINQVKLMESRRNLFPQKERNSPLLVE